jgi:KUP system potassium uptake protein
MQPNRSHLPLTFAALGVVYGDIGTSPLYAFREALSASHASLGDRAAVFGILSLLFWTLTSIVTIKYVCVMLRADNAGEGGILSLVALAQQRLGVVAPWAQRVVVLGVLGTALFYCEALITPAISVLSATEGLEVLDPGFKSAVLPVTFGVIIALFAIQKRGTERVARMFGPVMFVWFGTLGVLGAVQIVDNPAVLQALNPVYGIGLLVARPALALVILGAVFLAVTGAEALYADMGHFGRVPVQLAWLFVVWPSLLLNYFGQGALALSAQGTLINPFFSMAPPALLPLFVLLSTAATVIASQATISGAFSVTRMAVQLDLLPRVTVIQTSEKAHGQIYVPAANTFMLIAAIGFVLAFRSSSALSSAYGASVVCTMFIGSILGAVVSRTVWHWPWWRLIPVFGFFLLVDLAFIIANATKIPSGGWVPLTLAGLMFSVFLTWRDGRRRLRRELASRAVPLANLPGMLANIARVPGTAVFLVSDAAYVPTAMLRNLEHNHVCHEHIVILQMTIVRQPRVEPFTRAQLESPWPGIQVVRAHFGFMETPSVGDAIKSAQRRGLEVHVNEASFFVGWHLVRALPRPGWRYLSTALFAWLQRRSTQAAEFFQMPRRRVIMLATEVELR